MRQNFFKHFYMRISYISLWRLIYQQNYFYSSVDLKFISWSMERHHCLIWVCFMIRWCFVVRWYDSFIIRWCFLIIYWGSFMIRVSLWYAVVLSWLGGAFYDVLFHYMLWFVYAKIVTHYYMVWYLFQKMELSSIHVWSVSRVLSGTLSSIFCIWEEKIPCSSLHFNISIYQRYIIYS